MWLTVGSLREQSPGLHSKPPESKLRGGASEYQCSASNTGDLSTLSLRTTKKGSEKKLSVVFCRF